MTQSISTNDSLRHDENQINAAAGRYPRRGIALHWISALLILSMWPMGKLMAGNRGAEWAPTLIRIHTWAGILVLSLTLIRIVSLLAGPKVEKLDMPTWEHILYTANHLLLYVGLIAATATGLLMYRDADVSLFTEGDRLRSVGKLGDSERHETIANLMAVLFLMHLAGVLFYHFTKGRTLRRMGLPLGS